MKTIFLCFVAIAVFTFPTSAQWVKRDGGRLEWIGEMPGTHKECIRDKLLTGQCFYKVWRDMGFKDKMLEDLVKSEKDPSIYTHAVCAEIFMAQTLQKLRRVSAAVAQRQEKQRKETKNSGSLWKSFWKRN